MPHVKQPHTTVAFEHNGKRQTIGRHGILNSPDVDQLLGTKGVTGEVVVRHHEASRFGKPGRVTAMFKHRVRA